MGFPAGRIATRNELSARRRIARQVFAQSATSRPQTASSMATTRLLMRQVPALLAFHIEAREPWPAVADIDPYACNLRLLAISAADRADIASVFRLVPDQVRIVEIAADAFDRPPETTLAMRPRCSARHRGAEMRESARRNTAKTWSAAWVRQPAWRQRPTARAARRAGPAGRIRMFIGFLPARGRSLPRLTTRSHPWGGLHPRPAPRPMHNGRPPGLGLRRRRWPPASGGRVQDRRARQSAGVDRRQEYAGSSRQESGARARSHDLGREVMRGHEAIERLAGEMHAAILQLRMVPVARVFRSFPRLVRDTARELNKTVTLVLSGETTEADKTIVDHLFEPLLHLASNASRH